MIIGLVNRNTTTTSMTVVSPRVNAKPLTSPMEKYHSRAAARNDTVSETRTVRRARFQPRSTAVRRVRPSRTSSRSRSKNTTNESAVMPMATMRPATPARVSAKPWYLPSMTIDSKTSTAAMIRLDTATTASPR